MEAAIAWIEKELEKTRLRAKGLSKAPDGVFRYMEKDCLNRIKVMEKLLDILANKDPAEIYSAVAVLCVTPVYGESGELSELKQEEGQKLLTALSKTSGERSSGDNLTKLSLLLTHALRLEFKARNKSLSNKLALAS